MVRLMCAHCGLSYAGATVPQYLAASAGASCPRCGTPLTACQSVDDVAPAAAVTYRRRRLTRSVEEKTASV